MRVLNYLTSFTTALIVTGAILPMVIRLAPKIGAVDRPGGRRVHAGEIARLGGVGIFLGFVAGVGATLVLGGRVLSLSDPSEFRWYGAAIGACMIFASGLLDDIFELSPRVKFVLQVLAAATAVGMGVRIEAISSPFGDTVSLGILGPVITIAWILVVTNAINLIDGLDGLAGGIVLIVTTTAASVALARDLFSVVVISLALAGAITGFMFYNFAPAKIFMGDGGSQFLGFVIAIVAIRGSQKSATAVAVMVPLLVLGLPLMDVATTIFRRARRRGSEAGGILHRISRPDRSHLHHNLLDLGLTPRRAVLVLYLIATGFALSGYLSLVRNSLPLAVLTAVLSLGAIAAIKALVSDEPGRGVVSRLDRESRNELPFN